ncbi:hypothetical protein PGTUg99_029076 [Puccinia graminis f. sp. tritici]|uniref:Uncharacterized protein n=1 Tax=Puccinia graminis f. sp. tritici TaxID=56615 RepID=A0A5B0RXH6_PUCGR|nr:hypothetical protein PGTUg99_029076 [Puccinia graminis f. sp. tritici]
MTYPDAGSPLERVTDHIPAAIIAEGVNKGETFGDRRDPLLALIPPLPFDGDPMAYSSDQDGEYELDDSVLAPTPRTDQDHLPIVAGSPNPTGPGYVPNAHIEVGENVGLFNPNDDRVSHVDPLLQLPSEDNDQSDIDPYEDPTDTTYVPPKKSKRSYSGRKRSSGSLSPKPKPAFFCPRDSKGRFVSLQSKNLGKLKATSVNDQLPQLLSSSTSLPQAVFT